MRIFMIFDQKQEFTIKAKNVFKPWFSILAGIQILNQFQKIANFKRDYLDNDNDSEFTVKTKNAPFFMNFPNIYKLWQISLI